MRIQVEIIQEVEGMAVGSKRNLQPHIATSLIKRGFAKEIKRVKNPSNNKKTNRFEDAVQVSISKIELIKDGSPALITAALPMFESSDISFLQLDSLSAQKDAPAWELIVCEEKGEGSLGEAGLKKYTARLKKAGCVRIVYLSIEKWITLGQKWITIRDYMGEDSTGMMLCAADNYSPKDRIAESFAAMEAGYDWKQNNIGAFYSIKDHKAGFMHCKKDGPGLFMCMSKAAIDRVTTKPFPKSGVDSWLLKMSAPEKIKNDGKTIGVHTDGYNKISHHRKILYCREEATGMFKPADADKVFAQIPKTSQNKIKKLEGYKSK